jgi:hypothetical protein
MAGTLGALTALRGTVLGRTAALGCIALVVAVPGLSVPGISVLGLAFLEPVASDAGGGVVAAGVACGWGVVGGVFYLGQAAWDGQAVQGDGDTDIDMDVLGEGKVPGS